ncbi:MAG: antitermination protein [Rhodobacteraceae bacterium]|nr:antitermination protein [Paracoccaceae bacterium]
MKHWKIAGFVSLVAIAGVFYTAEGENTDMSRTDCADISLFAMPTDKTAEELCRNYGGVVKPQTSLSNQALVVLVRNQPAGGFEGQKTLH